MNKIYHGDCIEILKTIKPKSVQLVFADPPYNLSGNGLKLINNKTGGDYFMVNEAWDKMDSDKYERFTHEWVELCSKTLKDNGSIFIACSYHNIAEAITALKHSKFEIKNIITWQKTNAMPNLTRRVLTHTTEFVVWAVKGSGWVFNYEILKELNPDRQKDGSKKQLRDVW